MKNVMSPEKRTLSVHQEHELLLRLEQAGLNGELAQVVIGSLDNAMARQVIGLLQTKQAEGTNPMFTAIFTGADGKPLADLPVQLTIGRFVVGTVAADAQGQLQIDLLPTAIHDHRPRIRMTVRPGTPEALELPPYLTTHALQQIVTYQISGIKA